MLGARQEVLLLDLQVLLEHTAEIDFRYVLDERPCKDHDPVDCGTLAVLEPSLVEVTSSTLGIEGPAIVWAAEPHL